ncbi:hypothetical protein AVEN_251578-1 [Araneus ventricosus]|uniref:Uncharacterized protein n=1 Tax=Araneus ventricosus TaxID=182803 RepID=A0A4Y2R740_ARAVE|nr:hypothetical protein AVEN_251578-1 [Araneus ventricosus]
MDVFQKLYKTESENEENSSINIDARLTNTSGRRSQKRNKQLRKSQELTSLSLSQNKHNEEVAKDGTMWTTVPSDTVSLGRRHHRNVLREVPEPSAFAISSGGLQPDSPPPSGFATEGDPMGYATNPYAQNNVPDIVLGFPNSFAIE